MHIWDFVGESHTSLLHTYEYRKNSLLICWFWAWNGWHPQSTHHIDCLWRSYKFGLAICTSAVWKFDDSHPKSAYSLMFLVVEKWRLLSCRPIQRSSPLLFLICTGCPALQQSWWQPGEPISFGDFWGNWATKKKKKTPTFHYTGWLIGIFILVYYNP